MEMSSSDVKIEKSKLLHKYTYIKTTLYIIEKTKLNQSLQPKQRLALLRFVTFYYVLLININILDIVNIINIVNRNH